MRRPENLEIWIEELGLESSVRRLGWVEEPALAPLYRGAELGIYVSRHEGFGLPPLECLACGTPVVVSCRSRSGRCLVGLSVPDPGSRQRKHRRGDDGDPREYGSNGPRHGENRISVGPPRLGAELASVGGRTRAGSVAMISVIIVNHDGEAHLGRCLESVDGSGTEVLLVDNASRDGSVGLVQDRFPDVQVLEQEEESRLRRRQQPGSCEGRRRGAVVAERRCVVGTGSPRPARGSSRRSARGRTGCTATALPGWPTPVFLVACTWGSSVRFCRRRSTPSRLRPGHMDRLSAC